MKIIPIQLLNHIKGRLTSLSMCWLITRSDGVVQGFTDAPDDLLIDGQAYLSITGFEPTAIESSGGMAVDNMELNGLLNSDAITSRDLAAGVYDYAEVTVFNVNRRALADGRTPLKKGFIGQITLEQGKFVAEVRGLMQSYSQSIVEVYSKTCRAVLGDSRCTVAMASFTVSGAVETAPSNHSFTDPARTEPEKYFAYGKITFTSGENMGVRRNIRASNGPLITLLLPLPHPLAVGDTYDMTAGCDSTVETCKARFSNVVNFRGEPNIPDESVTRPTPA